LAAASADVTLSADPERIANAVRLVLPGVGSFAAAMRWLDATGVADAVRTAVSRGALLLGVCVGHQVLFDDSEEDGQRRGLGSAFATLVEQAIAGWSAITCLRIGVALSNPRALGFWKRIDYVETGEVKPAESINVMITVLEKPVRRIGMHG